MKILTLSAQPASGTACRNRPVFRLTWPNSVAIGAFCLIATACGAKKDDPKIQLNPRALSRHEITARVEDLPGRFDHIAAFANYQVSNEACVPMTPVAGVKMAPIKQVSLDLATMSDGTFKITVFADRMLDEDYFGRGICHWSMTATTFVVTKGKTSFVASLDLREILAGNRETRFYAAKTFEGTIPISDTGLASKPSNPDVGNTFSISLIAASPSI